MLSVEQALERMLAAADPIARQERVSTLAAHGRVLATPVVSAIAVPPADDAQMDGYALRCADVLHVPATLPVSQRIAAGHPGVALAPRTAARIFTGAPIPAGADAVVMQEDTAAAAGGVTVLRAPAPGQWIRRTGMAVQAGSTVLAAGTRLTPPALGMAAAVGADAVEVVQPLRVATFFTGDELVMPGTPLPPGCIYNSSRYVLRTLLERLGCTVVDLGIVPDRLDRTRAALVDAARGVDLILTAGGVSVGEEDHVRPAVQAEGALDLWQIAMKPGKPLAFGHVRQVPFVGLPGNPVSSFVTFLLFVRPFVLRRQGVHDVLPRRASVPAAAPWNRPDGRREFLRARLDARGALEFFPNQNASVLASTVWADGLVDNPAGHVIAAGDPVSFLSFAELLA